ncbi:MAG: hypothetical protein V4658_04035 [Bacteroidota bacterium]
MFNQENKILQAIQKFIRDTRDGTMTWDSVSKVPYSLSPSEQIKENSYVASSQGRKIRFYKYFANEITPDGVTILTPHYRLEILSSETDKVQYSFPEYSALGDLHDSITYKTSRMDDFFENLLKGETNKDNDFV